MQMLTLEKELWRPKLNLITWQTEDVSTERADINRVVGTHGFVSNNLEGFLQSS